MSNNEFRRVEWIRSIFFKTGRTHSFGIPMIPSFDIHDSVFAFLAVSFSIILVAFPVSGNVYSNLTEFLLIGYYAEALRAHSEKLLDPLSPSNADVAGFGEIVGPTQI